LLAAASLLGACASNPPARPLRTEAFVADAAYAIEGRLSAKRGTDALAANFRWTHDPGADTIALSSPLGQMLARLSGTLSGARIERADGTADDAPDWESLTLRALAVPLPVSGLAWWIRGVPHPLAAHTLEVDELGRPSVLRQDGWEIVYAYADDSTRQPSRVRLTWPEVEVRIVIDRWQ
jgi:outer membrane lipoprotein LolB